MSYVNLPPEATFAKLERVMKNQRRLMMVDAGVLAVFATSIIASVMTLL